jgi:pimeloyl-ACP methyl ester carboxylesterase
MPLLRFSFVGGKLAAPETDGRWRDSAYNADLRTGVLFDLDNRPPNGPDEVARYAADSLATVRADGPIVFMVNGYEFDPRAPLGANDDEETRSDNPHAIIFHFKQRDLALEQARHCTGWPRRLGFQPGAGDPGGLAVAFGWWSQNRHGSHFEAYQEGLNAAKALLLAMEAVAAARPDLPINVFAHSLGSHVALRCLAEVVEQDNVIADRLRRVVLIGGSEFSGVAFSIYNALKEKGLFDRLGIYNVADAKDEVTQEISELATFGPDGAKHMICHHGLKPTGGDPLGNGQPGWIDLDLARPELRNWARETFGVVLRAALPGDRNHWVYFTDPGNTEFLKHLLRDGDGEVGLAALRQNAGIEGLIA